MNMDMNIMRTRTRSMIADMSITSMASIHTPTGIRTKGMPMSTGRIVTMSITSTRGIHTRTSMLTRSTTTRLSTTNITARRMSIIITTITNAVTGTSAK